MISIEAHRAAIGRFYGKAKIQNKSVTMKGVDNLTLFLLIITIILSMICYIFSIGIIMYICYDHFIPHILQLMILYGSSIYGICMYLNLLVTMFQKTMNEHVLMRESSADKTLIQCKYADTFVLNTSVLDGRDRKSPDVEMKFCVENGQIYFLIDEKTCNIDSEMIYNIIVKICSYILILACISFWLYVSYTVFMNKSVINSHFNNYIGHENNTQNNLELYLLNHLKLAQLLIDGDVESNPGPVTNNIETPKRVGRPKKGSKGFNLKPKKLDFTSGVDNNRPTSSTSTTTSVDIAGIINNTYLNNIDYSLVTGDTINRNFPVRLRNEGVNVCFFNSIIQALYSLPLFHTYLEQTSIDDNILNKLKDLFQTMRNTNEIVQTSTYIRALENDFTGYTFGIQYDAEECLRKILEICYPYCHESTADPDYDSNKFIFRVKFNETLECEQRLGGCGTVQDKYEHHQILKLKIEETLDFQSVEHILTYYNGDNMPEDYRCQLGPSGGCNTINSCTKQSLLYELKDVLVIQLLIYSYDALGRKRKLFPNLNIERTITPFEKYNLQAIIWHHGASLESGHYTAMVKHNRQWIHISDTDITYPIKFSCNSHEQSDVPYLLFYTKDVTNVNNNISLNTDTFTTETESIDFTIHDRKRSYEVSIEDLDEDNLNSTKMSKLEKDSDSENKLGKMETFIDLGDETEISLEDENVNENDNGKFNFGKRKSNFSDKKTEYMRNVRKTDEGRDKNQACARAGMQKIRSTPQGREKNRAQSEKIRSTPQGQTKHNEAEKKRNEKIRNTEKGKMKQRDTDRISKENIRNTAKTEHSEKLATLPFPPVITDELEKECIKNYIKETSPESLKTIECGICGEAVRNSSDFVENKMIYNIPHRDLLSTEHSEENLEEYIIDELLLSPGGVQNGQTVNCCKKCLNYLDKEKLPPLSIANNFQIGKTPPELTDLTIPEKL